jgi:hypothetical protein
VLLLAVCELRDLGHQLLLTLKTEILIGLAFSIVGNLAAASVGGGGERIERLVKLDAVGASTRAVVFVRRIVTDD